MVAGPYRGCVRRGIVWLAAVGLAGGCDSDGGDDGAGGTDAGSESSADGADGATPDDDDDDDDASDTGGSSEGGADESSDGGVDDTGDTSDDTTDTGVDPPDGLVPAFVAQGHMGRTMLSCDDGQTWIADTSLDDTIRCFEGIDCDHHEGSATGVTYGDGLFVTTWGWGTEGNIQISSDGVSWETVLTGPTFSGTAFGNDVFIAGARSPFRADATATMWTDLGDSGLDEWTPRGIGFANVDGGRFIIGGGGGTGDVVVSATDGDDWFHPEGIVDACGSSISGITGGGTAIVIATRNQDPIDLCVSTDGGVSFTTIDLPEPMNTPAIWTGTELVGFSDSSRLTSDDGVDWTSTPFATPDARPGAVARSPDGTFVGQRNGWMVWYEEQTLYRSTDGLTWTELGPDAFTGGHPIRRIAHGRVEPTEDGCPAP